MAELKNLIVEGDSRLIGDTNAGNITATTLKKSGGTSSQFLKADGSVDSNTYATTSQIPVVPTFSSLTLSKTAQAYDGTHTLALPSTDPYTTARTPSSHTHGNIQNGGTLQTNDITIANGDKLVVTDSSDSSKIARTSVSFDGSTTTKALTPKGTFETFLQSHQSVVNGGNTASWGSSCTVGTVGGTALTFTMPANPNTNTTYTLTSPTSGTNANKLVLTPSSGSAQVVTVAYATAAGGANAAGSADIAGLLATNGTAISKGSATNPVYFDGGVPKACTYSLNKTVPSDAVFTDTTYSSKAAASGGTDVSLCTTGEKYIWNSKVSLSDLNQAVAGRALYSDTVTAVSYDTTNKKITRTKNIGGNASTADVVTAATIVTDGGGLKASDKINRSTQSGSLVTGFAFEDAGSTCIHANIDSIQTSGGHYYALPDMVSAVGSMSDRVLEYTGNKVTSISSSSTDAQYPTAKCVYTLIGDIESALSALR